MQKLGQHFLKNDEAIEAIVAAIDPQAGDTIIEIGPGHGELTRPLADICEKIGARIIAVEKDEKLHEKLDGKMIEGVTIVSGDVLEILPTLVADLKLSEASHLKIVGNIPYYITGHLLRTIGELDRKPERSILMIQKEVAERICEKPPAMNRLAASVQWWADPRIILSVPKKDFSPPPQVDSSVIELASKDPQPKDAEQYYSAMRVLFAQPRKTILNNLAAQEDNNKDDIVKKLTSIGIDATLRPQNLSIDDIIKVAGAFF